MSKKKTKILIFAVASFLNDLGSDMIYPVWPLFVTVFLGANMTILGFIDGVGDALVSISQAVAGYFSDRLKKRKIFIWTGYLMSSLSRLGYALSPKWQYLIPFKIIDRSGKIRGAPRDAFVAELSTDSDRATNFGILRMMDNLGAFCGIVACIFLFRYFGYRNLFMIAAFPSIISASLILTGIKERKIEKIKLYKGIRLKDLDRNFRVFLFLSALFSLGFFSYSFLLIFANQFGFKATFIPIFYLEFTAIASISSLPFGRLADKIGRKPVLWIAFIFWGATCISAIVAKSNIMIYVLFGIYGLHKGAIEPVQRSFVAELSPPEFKASGLGSFQMVVGLCALPASLIAGILWDTISPSAPFYFSLSLTLVVSILLFFVKRDINTENKNLKKI